MKIRKRFWAGFLMLGLLLGVHKGYIALWRDDDPAPFRILPYKVALLPEKEQRLLEEGIRIRDERHLHSLLDEYLS